MTEFKDPNEIERACIENSRSVKRDFERIYQKLKGRIYEICIKNPLLSTNEIVSKVNIDCDYLLLKKHYLFLYSCYFETLLLKLLYNPCSSIKKDIIEDLFLGKYESSKFWKKYIDTVFDNLTTEYCKDINSLWYNEENLIQTIKDYYSKKLEKLIKSKAFIRNKIAHGQWIIAFNSQNTNINSEINIKQDIEDIDIVQVYNEYKISTQLIEDLEIVAESPENTQKGRSFIASFNDRMKKIDDMIVEVSEKIHLKDNKNLSIEDYINNQRNSKSFQKRLSEI